MGFSTSTIASSTAITMSIGSSIALMFILILFSLLGIILLYIILPKINKSGRS